MKSFQCFFDNQKGKDIFFTTFEKKFIFFYKNKNNKYEQFFYLCLCGLRDIKRNADISDSFDRTETVSDPDGGAMPVQVRRTMYFSFSEYQFDITNGKGESTDDKTI